MISDELETTCRATFMLDFDSLWCDLPDGHEGLHRSRGEQGLIDWQECGYGFIA